MKSAYYDATYLFKLQCEETGTPAVRAHASTVHAIYSCLHGRAEFASTCHRKIREGSGTPEHLLAMLSQIHAETAIGALVWLPLNENIVTRVETFFSTAPADIFLRTADALHLACAAENSFTEVYSNDRQFLAAAPLFGLRGVNVITG